MTARRLEEKAARSPSQPYAFFTRTLPTFHPTPFGHSINSARDSIVTADADQCTSGVTLSFEGPHPEMVPSTRNVANLGIVYSTRKASVISISMMRIADETFHCGVKLVYLDARCLSECDSLRCVIY